MQTTRIALIQTMWPGERERMQDTYRRLLKQAVAEGAQIVCLPEFSLSPYFPGTPNPAGFQWAESLTDGPSARFFSEMARHYKINLIGSLFEQTADEQYRDTATIHNPHGELVGFTRKVHIPSGEGYHETEFFAGGIEYPVHDLGMLKVAVPTCYDQWFPEMARICALKGAEFIFYPTAIGSEPTAPQVDTQGAWQTVMQGHAIANGVYIAAANRIGRENQVTFYGSSFICDPQGKILAQASRDQTEVIYADLQPAMLEQWRELFPLLHQRRPETYARLTGNASEPPPARWRDQLSHK